ncbi:RNA polymerase sigma factor [Pseudomonas aeruginosa VRFPA09]|nr:RNA polymerase sigma factor [Pseudomonas aeruginosa VRFPA09]
MTVKISQTADVQRFFEEASGQLNERGDPRTKALVRRILDDTAKLIEEMQVTPDEFWKAVDYLNRLGSRQEAGLLAAGLGLEHYLDLLLDAQDAEAGLTGGTPRTIEGATNRIATAPAKTCWPACAKARRPSRALAGGCYCKKAAASRQCDSLSFMCRPNFPMSAPILLSAHHRAMHALYSEHHGWLQNWLRGKLGCAADAADLAQDTFLRILLKRELREIGMPRAFLRTIARGLVIDHWRREELQRAYLESIAHLPEAQAPSPEARELVLELLEEISRMLDGLKPKVRTAFLLAQCEDLSHRQIAERIGVSQRSVERYVAEALYHCYLLRYGE